MSSEVDEHGIPLRGRALHIACYVNCEPKLLSAAVLGRRSAASIVWRGPLAARHFAEYKDRQFLTAVDRGELAEQLAEWWPESGPRWDALGIVEQTNEVVLLRPRPMSRRSPTAWRAALARPVASRA
jgi:hypothetical protein